MNNEDGMRAISDLIRSVLATRGDGDKSESPESPRQAPLWAGFVLGPTGKTVELRSLSLDKDEAIKGTIDGDHTHIIMDITRDDSHHEFTEWLVEVGDFIATEAGAEWDRLLKEAKGRWEDLGTRLATKAAVLGDLTKVPGLAPCPACGETRQIGLKACMASGGTRCCPWVRCKTCHYSGPMGIDRPGTDGQPATDAAVEAVRAWNDGDIDLVMFTSASIEKSGKSHEYAESRGAEIGYYVMEGGPRFRELLANADETERRALETMARMLRRRIEEIEEAIGKPVGPPKEI